MSRMDDDFYSTMSLFVFAVFLIMIFRGWAHNELPKWAMDVINSVFNAKP